MNPEPASKNSKPVLYLTIVGLGAVAVLGLLRSQAGPGVAPAGTSEPTPEVRLNRSGTLTTSPGNPLSDSFSEAQLVFFTPDDSGNMKKRTLPPSGDIPKDARAAKEKLSAQAVQALLQAAPEVFPPGTTLQGASLAGGVLALNFNASFADANFWQGSARTTAALDALALSVAGTKNQISGGEADGVRFLAEGKPLQTLGEMDLSKPYLPSAKAPPGSAP